ncbi:MAG: flagellar motor protein [Bryobacteraceae bacterium]|jgi:chemotaxis protein MotA
MAEKPIATPPEAKGKPEARGKPAAKAKPEAGGKSSSRGRPDLATIGGFAVAIIGILGGLLLEGGKFSDVRQFTAGMIVLGGTFGAVMITTPLSLLFAAVKKLPLVFWDRAVSSTHVVEEILGYATRARKNGIVSLEADIDNIGDPFLRKALSLAVDGTDLQDLRRMMDLELHLEEQRGEAEAKVFECAGGYSPTIGIIGAVLGLIQVMKHLENIEEVGKGIAVAFVATVYGLLVANIVMLPTASKLKSRLQDSIRTKEMMLEGVCSIAEGLNPKLIRSKLEAYLREELEAEAKKKKKKDGKTAAPAKAPAPAASGAAARGAAGAPVGAKVAATATR